MNEKKKLDEAKYFYSEMIIKQLDLKIFTYNLSAFLSSARSILLYALNEASSKTNGRKWYNKWISSSKILKFFRNKRNFNIHTKPIQPKANIKLKSRETIHLSDSLLIKIKDKDGKIAKQQVTLNNFEPLTEESEISVDRKIIYKFDDWHGNEDILYLCQMYIKELEKLIKDGIKKGFITG